MEASTHQVCRGGSGGACVECFIHSKAGLAIKIVIEATTLHISKHYNHTQHLWTHEFVLAYPHKIGLHTLNRAPTGI